MNLLDAYLAAYRIRRVELEISERYHPDEGDAPMRTPTHLSVGSEHVAVAVADAVPPGSHAYSTHRSHAHYLAWGGDLIAMVAELHGRSTGCANGWGGSMHLIDEAAGFMGTSAIVGSSVSLAVGDAFARQLREDEIVRGSDQSIPSPDDAVTVAFAGDAVPETGQFWEALNFAALKQLRLIIVIEDNGLATSTPLHERQDAFHAPIHRVVDAEAETYSEIKSQVVIAVDNDHWPIVIRVPVPRMAVHVGPAIDDRIGTGDDQLMAMRVASVAWHDAPKTTLAEAEHFIDCGVAAVFDEMADFDLHPWAKGMNE